MYRQLAVLGDGYDEAKYEKAEDLCDLQLFRLFPFE